MPIYEVYAEWTVGGFFRVEAKDAQEAKGRAHDADLDEFAHVEYVPGTFQIPDWFESVVLEKRRKVEAIGVSRDVSISPNSKSQT
jgi:hypothetical protein